MDVSISFILPTARRFHYQYCLVNSQDITVLYLLIICFTTHQCRWLLSGGWLNGRNLGGSLRGLIKVFSQHLSGWAEDNRENLRIACVMAENRTGHLPTTSLQQYRYTNLLKGIVFAFIRNLSSVTHFSAVRSVLLFVLLSRQRIRFLSVTNKYQGWSHDWNFKSSLSVKLVCSCFGVLKDFEA
jgi:hypothetical protein